MSAFGLWESNKTKFSTHSLSVLHSISAEEAPQFITSEIHRLLHLVRDCEPHLSALEPLLDGAVASGAALSAANDDDETDSGLAPGADINDASHTGDGTEQEDTATQQLMAGDAAALAAPEAANPSLASPGMRQSCPVPQHLSSSSSLFVGSGAACHQGSQATIGDAPPTRAAKRRKTSLRLQEQFEDLASEIQEDRRERQKQFEELMTVVKLLVRAIERDDDQ